MLINWMLSVMDIEICNHKLAPADKIPVGKDGDGDPCMEEWKYHSIAGMMIYLTGSTRPDIAFAVH